jgi:hypothetical protein
MFCGATLSGESHCKTRGGDWRMPPYASGVVDYSRRAFLRLNRVDTSWSTSTISTPQLASAASRSIRATPVPANSRGSSRASGSTTLDLLTEATGKAGGDEPRGTLAQIVDVGLERQAETRDRGIRIGLDQFRRRARAGRQL